MPIPSDTSHESTLSLFVQVCLIQCRRCWNPGAFTETPSVLSSVDSRASVFADPRSIILEILPVYALGWGPLSAVSGKNRVHPLIVHGISGSESTDPVPSSGDVCAASRGVRRVLYSPYPTPPATPPRTLPSYFVERNTRLNQVLAQCPCRSENFFFCNYYYFMRTLATATFWCDE